MLWVRIPSGQGDLISSSIGRARSKNPSRLWSHSLMDEYRLVTPKIRDRDPLRPLQESEKRRFQDIDFDSLEQLPHALLLRH